MFAAQRLLSEDTDVAIAGGIDVADLHSREGRDDMRANTRIEEDAAHRASRPYASDRAGFVFREAAGMLVMERQATPRALSAEVLDHPRGSGMSSDGAGEMVRPTVEGPPPATSNAPERAGLDTPPLAYVNTNPSGTSADAVETQAMAEITRAPDSCTKAYSGHAISGGDPLAAVATLEMLRGGWLAPSTHASPSDLALPLPPIPEPTRTDTEIAMSNSFEFGETRISLILGR